MEAIFNSFFLVFASELGDKTQLLALVLVSRFRKPWTIMAGILVATLLNHAFASWAGQWIASLIAPQTLTYILAATFMIFGLWILIPDKDEDLKYSSKFGAFFTTVVAFFLAEMGDKTQLATVALGAKYNNLLLVTAGSTAAMMASDGLAVFLGDKLTQRLSMTWIRRIACVLFFVFGAALIAGF